MSVKNGEKRGKLGLEMSLESAWEVVRATVAESDRAMRIEINLSRERKCTFNITQFYSKENDLETLPATNKTE